MIIVDVLRMIKVFRNLELELIGVKIYEFFQHAQQTIHSLAHSL